MTAGQCTEEAGAGAVWLSSPQGVGEDDQTTWVMGSPAYSLSPEGRVVVACWRERRLIKEKGGLGRGEKVVGRLIPGRKKGRKPPKIKVVRKTRGTVGWALASIPGSECERLQWA